MRKWKELREEDEVEKVLLRFNCLEIEKSSYGTIKSIVLLNEENEVIKIRVDSVYAIEEVKKDE